MNDTIDSAPPEPTENQPSQTENGAAASPEAEIVQLKEEVVKLKDLYLRAMAETENVRSRAKREQEDANKYAVTKFARDMVGMVENFQRASQSISAEARAKDATLKQIGEGIDMTLQELLGVLERHGIKRIDPVGEKFDHNLHQAVMQVENNDIPEGTVVSVMQAGYIIHDRLLRPAMVSVAKASSSTSTNSAA